jgi:citrate lyase subunit beta/citryl-CoA lyase
MALIESARGLVAARAIALASARLAFGSIDFAADLGCAHGREALLAARLELVIASRLAGIAPPIDGVTDAVRDPDQVRADATHAAALGFGGKLLIHPAQIAPARAGFQPNAEEIAWAERVLAAGDGAVTVDGALVDAPVRIRAKQIRRRAGAI